MNERMKFHSKRMNKWISIPGIDFDKSGNS